MQAKLTRRRVRNTAVYEIYCEGRLVGVLRACYKYEKLEDTDTAIILWKTKLKTRDLFRSMKSGLSVIERLAAPPGDMLIC